MRYGSTPIGYSSPPPTHAPPTSLPPFVCGTAWGVVGWGGVGWGEFLVHIFPYLIYHTIYGRFAHRRDQSQFTLDSKRIIVSYFSVNCPCRIGYLADTHFAACQQLLPY